MVAFGSKFLKVLFLEDVIILRIAFLFMCELLPGGFFSECSVNRKQIFEEECYMGVGKGM